MTWTEFFDAAERHVGDVDEVAFYRGETLVSHYGPGSQPVLMRAGDFTLHRATTSRGPGGATTTLGKLIQAGERTRFGNTDFARWTHCTLVVDSMGTIIEATERGVTTASIAKYRDSDYMLVRPQASVEQRALACQFARDHLRDGYGILNFVGLVEQSLLGWSLSLHMDQQFICSGLLARATEKYVATYPRSPEDMMPGDLAKFWGAESGEPLPRLGFLGRALNLLVTISELIR